MSNDKLILYDLPSKDKGCACWSLNPWKTRLALNYKGIDYETQWVEYPDVAPLFKSFGIPPQEGEIKPFTIPAVRFPQDGGAHLMNSKPIADEIEKRYPAPTWPSLHLDNPVVEQAYALTRAAAAPLRAVMLPPIPRNILRDVSSEYFSADRKVLFGMPLDELEAKKGGEPAWAASREAFGKIAEALRKEEGPYFLGETVSYADFIVVGFLHFLKRTVGDKQFQHVEEWPEIIALYQACAKWLERDSY